MCWLHCCLLYTSDATDEEDSVDLGGRRIIKKNFFQAEDGIRDRSPSRGLGDVYKRQLLRLLKERSDTAMRSGLILSQAGEFGFVLVALLSLIHI